MNRGDRCQVFRAASATVLAKCGAVIPLPFVAITEDVTETVDPIFTGLLVDWRDIPQTADLRRPSDFVHLAQEAEARFGIERATAALSGNLLTFVRRALT